MARDADPFLLFFFTSIACIVLHCMRRLLANWAIQTLIEAGEGNSPLIKFYEWVSSSLLLIPTGFAFMVMGTFILHHRLVETFLPWWLCVWLGFEALIDGVDSLLRNVFRRRRCKDRSP